MDSKRLQKITQATSLGLFDQVGIPVSYFSRPDELAIIARAPNGATHYYCDSAALHCHTRVYYLKQKSSVQN